MINGEDAEAIDAAARLMMLRSDRAPGWRPTARCGRTDAHGPHSVAPTWCAGNLDVLEAKPTFTDAIERITAETDADSELDPGYVIGSISCAARAFLDDDRSEDPYLAQARVVLQQVVDVERHGQSPREAADVLTSAIDEAEGLFDPIRGPYVVEWYDD